MIRRPFYFLLLGTGSLLLASLSIAAPRKGVFHQVAVDIPFQGGAMVTASRLWQIGRNVEAGFVISGGRIDREFDLDVAGNPEARAETQSIVFPFVGPRIALTYNFVGVSLAYGAYYATSDMTVRNVAGGDLTGETKGWGTGFYSPLLTLDFYDKKRDVIFGFGLGGFFGLSGPDLKASSATTQISTKSSPINSLTFHIRVLWAADRKRRLDEPDDFEF